MLKALGILIKNPVGHFEAMQHPDDFVSSIWARNAFDGKVVFCTGGSGDICSGQVRALVYLGANACIVGRNPSKAVRVAANIATVRQGAKVVGYGGIDVRDEEGLQRAVADCVRELGGIDFVIAGAAGNFLAPLTHLSTNAFRTVLEIDLLGAWNTAKATWPILLKAVERSASTGAGPSGRIIFISSTLQYTGVQLNTHGVVAKAGVDALAAQLAIELGPRGLTSNVIAPGPIGGTEGMFRLIETGEQKDPSRAIPLQRLGLVKDIADATVYLLSDAGNYVNGATIVVDGGAWRTSGGQVGSGYPYPEFLLANQETDGASRKGNAKL